MILQFIIISLSSIVASLQAPSRQSTLRRTGLNINQANTNKDKKAGQGHSINSNSWLEWGDSKRPCPDKGSRVSSYLVFCIAGTETMGENKNSAGSSAVHHAAVTKSRRRLEDSAKAIPRKRTRIYVSNGLCRNDIGNLDLERGPVLVKQVGQKQGTREN